MGTAWPAADAARLLQRAGGQAGEPGAAGAELALLGGGASLCGLGCLSGATLHLWERRFTLSRRCCYWVKAQLGVHLNFSLKSLIVLEAAFLKNPPLPPPAFLFFVFFFYITSSKEVSYAQNMAVRSVGRQPRLLFLRVSSSCRSRTANPSCRTCLFKAAHAWRQARRLPAGSPRLWVQGENRGSVRGRFAAGGPAAAAAGIRRHTHGWVAAGTRVGGRRQQGPATCAVSAAARGARRRWRRPTEGGSTQGHAHAWRWGSAGRDAGVSLSSALAARLVCQQCGGVGPWCRSAALSVESLLHFSSRRASAPPRPRSLRCWDQLPAFHFPPNAAPPPLKELFSSVWSWFLWVAAGSFSDRLTRRAGKAVSWWFCSVAANQSCRQNGRLLHRKHFCASSVTVEGEGGECRFYVA